MAPEIVNVLLGEGKRDHLFGLAIDIWALGITIIELYDTEPPMAYARMGVLVSAKFCNRKNLAFSDSSNPSVALQDLVNRCLTKLNNRPTAEDLMDDRFVVDNNVFPLDFIKYLKDEYD